MADHSDIEWTDATWNPITGCSILSPGCARCYAMKLAGTRMRNHPSRRGLTQESKNGPVWNGKVRFNDQWLRQPLEWTRPRMIFVCAHGDLFHENVPDEWIDDVFAVMASAPHHTFQVLTKRPDRMRRYVDDGVGRVIARQHRNWHDRDWPGWPLPNVWLGVSTERQQEYEERKQHLRETPAAIRFFSMEPLLGPIEADWLGDWVIVGGESGDGARPMHHSWPRAIERQCAAAGVPFHFKQWGAWLPVCATTDELVNSLYHPAPARDPEGRRRCKVDSLVLHADGSQHRGYGPETYASGSGAMQMFNVGKGRAGRLLNGVEYNGMPERRAP
ncbi:protein gp37 [Bradyrhizobium sp. USDA 3311]